MKTSVHPSLPAPPTPGGAAPYFVSGDKRFALYNGDCLALMPQFPDESFDLIFADPPYFLSNGGITCHAGKMVSVNKGKWDQSKGFEANYDFTRRWIAACRRLLKPNGSIWISGTSHIIHIVGCCLDELGYKILNDITWVKTNPPPNLSCRYFTHATETILWAGRDKNCRHKFNYPLMKRLNGGKQMTSVWTMDAPRRDEKVFGKHPTQKPLGLLERIIAAASDENDVVLDPFSGSATTGIAAARLNRISVGLEMESEYLNLGTARFVGVPQADDPERIIEVLRFCNREPPSITGISRAGDVTERQVHYYLQAAEILGLLTRNQGEPTLTETGHSVCAAETGRVVLSQCIHNLPVVQHAIAATRSCINAKTARARLATMLTISTPLGTATCERRAQTLMAWIQWATAVKSNYPIFAASKEKNDSPITEIL